MLILQKYLKVVLIILGLTLCVISIKNTNNLFFVIGVFYFVFALLRPNINFYILVIVCFGLAVLKILAFRIDVGIPINVLDVLILVLLVNMVLRKKEYESNAPDSYRYLIYSYIIFSVYALAIGVIRQYSFYNILKDARVPIYFLVVYYYARLNLTTLDKMKKLLNLILISGILVSIQQIYTFITEGTNSNFSDYSGRDVSTPIGTAILALLLLVIYFKSTPGFKKMKVLYFCSLSILGIGIVFSLTRSVWISLILTAILYYVLMPNKTINFKKMIIYSLIILIGIALFQMFFADTEVNKIVNLINMRVNDTLMMFTNNGDTIAGRFNVAGYAIKQINSLGLFMGKGFGSYIVLPASLNGTEIEIIGLENSFLHYCWKFGIFGSIFTFLMFILKIIDIYKGYKENKKKKYSNIVLAFFSYSAILFIISIWSQGINIAYVMPAWGIFLGMNYRKIMESVQDD